MQTCGIICEYNPLHLGHKKQIDLVHAQGGAVVCLMSGNFVQRGHPAIVDKTLRAKAAMRSGADLVLELPLTRALSSAESFAAGGVEILSKLCDSMCFGAETADADALMHTAALLLSPAFSQHLRTYLDQGLSFPAARAMALDAMSPLVSLSDSAFGDEEGVELGAVLPDENSSTEIERLCDRIALGQAVSRMPHQWQQIVMLRFYRNRTQQQTADALGLSQVKISREEKKILDFLRTELSP